MVMGVAQIAPANHALGHLLSLIRGERFEHVMKRESGISTRFTKVARYTKDGLRTGKSLPSSHPGFDQRRNQHRSHSAEQIGSFYSWYTRLALQFCRSTRLRVSDDEIWQPTNASCGELFKPHRCSLCGQA